MTQAIAAEGAGITPKQWSRIENETTGTQKLTLQRIALSLQLNEEEILYKAGLSEKKITHSSRESDNIEELKLKILDLEARLSYVTTAVIDMAEKQYLKDRSLIDKLKTSLAPPSVIRDEWSRRVISNAEQNKEKA